MLTTPLAGSAKSTCTLLAASTACAVRMQVEADREAAPALQLTARDASGPGGGRRGGAWWRASIANFAMRSAWSGWACGRPATAMKASPMVSTCGRARRSFSCGAQSSAAAAGAGETTRHQMEGAGEARLEDGVLFRQGVQLGVEPVQHVHHAFGRQRPADVREPDDIAAKRGAARSATAQRTAGGAQPTHGRSRGGSTGGATGGAAGGLAGRGGWLVASRHLKKIVTCVAARKSRRRQRRRAQAQARAHAQAPAQAQSNRRV